MSIDAEELMMKRTKKLEEFVEDQLKINQTIATCIENLEQRATRLEECVNHINIKLAQRGIPA